MRKKALCLLMAAFVTVSMITPSFDVSAAAKVKLSKKKVTLKVGEKTTLTVKKGKKKVKGVKWSTRNKKVATVKSGKVTAKAAGSTTIVAKYKAGKKYKSLKCKVTVTAASNSSATSNASTNQTASSSQNNNQSANNNQSTNKQSGSNQSGSNSGNNQSGNNQSGNNNPSAQEPTDPTVVWTTTEEPYEGLFSAVNGKGETENFPIQLLRKYVSFNPWPTTTAQVEYVIKNCNDPYVIAALYVVALDNMEKPDSLSDNTNKVFDMLNALQTGAGAISGDKYLLNNFAKQHINEYWGKKGSNGVDYIPIHEFASRTFLKGAKDTNNYTPDGGMDDKTKWQIIIDQYPYCFDQDNENYADKKWITLCPRRFTYEQEVENGPLVEKEHSQVLRIGFRWNGGKSVWLPTDYAKINTDPGQSALEPYNVQASILFSNDYRAPQVSQGW